jgi:tripartite-type tricarboxylate transporter receptor subunit TctC
MAPVVELPRGRGMDEVGCGQLGHNRSSPGRQRPGCIDTTDNDTETVMNRRKLLLAAAAAPAAGALPSTFAQPAYPSKNINYIIPFAAGGESDVVARWQQDLFQRKFAPHTMVVINRAGAGGALAWSSLNREAPDGHTVMGANMPHLVLQPLEANNPYKAEDVVCVYFFNVTPDAIVVPSTSPYKTLKDLIDDARRNPEKVSFAGSGINGANQAATMRLCALAGIKVTYVPFKGTGDLVGSLIGGHVSAAMSYNTLGLQQKDKTRMLAVATEKRDPKYPEVPTFKELGFNWVDGGYRGVAVPKSTPEAVRRQVSDLFAQLNKDPEMRKRKAAAGFDLVDVSYDQMEGFIKERAAAYQDDARRLGLIK